jgi:hypothetical protein
LLFFLLVGIAAEDRASASAFDSARARKAESKKFFWRCQIERERELLLHPLDTTPKFYPHLGVHSSGFFCASVKAIYMPIRKISPVIDGAKKKRK